MTLGSIPALRSFERRNPVSLFFNQNKFYKPGKGVEKDEPERIAPIKFFELYGRKFGKFVELNLISFVVMLPIILFIYAMIYSNYSNTLESAGLEISSIWTLMLQVTLMYHQYVPAIIRNILLVISILAYGPLKAGMTYVMRNYSLENHAWLSDIWERAKSNFKQALFAGLVDVLVVVVFVYNLFETPDGGIYTLAKYVSIIFCLFYSFMRRYIYEMIVTVELPMSAIFRNSLLLAFIGIFRNLLATILNVGIWVLYLVLIIGVTHLAEIVLLPFLIFSFTNFISVFTTYPVVQKYIVDPALEAQEGGAIADE